MSVKDTYNALSDEIRIYGLTVPSRFGKTREVIGECFSDYDCSIPVRTKMNLKLATVETLQILAGIFDPEKLKEAAPNAAHDLFTEQMAYGPRLLPIYSLVSRALINFPGTRQAVLLLNQPSQTGSDNLTCTLGIQFLQRGITLTSSVFMRSWDLVKGTPYDLFFFQVLNAVMAHVLAIVPGNLHVLASSVHVYENDWSLARAIDYKRIVLPKDVPCSWEEIPIWAQDCLNGTLPSFVSSSNE